MRPWSGACARRPLSAAIVALVLAVVLPGQAQDLPDEATRERVADRMAECLGIWRELSPLGLSAEKYAGEQGMREFLARW